MTCTTVTRVGGEKRCSSPPPGWEKEQERRKQEEAQSREQELALRLEQVEVQAVQLEEEVARLGRREGQGQEELVARRKESKVTGERCMRLLEQLDGMQMESGLVELRSRRKGIATKLNKILDINDSNIQVG